MKKLFLLSALVLFISSLTFSQSTSPRFGTVKNQDNTARVLTYSAISKVYAATDVVKPVCFDNLIVIGTLTGAQTLTATVTGCYLGDRMTILFLADGTNRVVTFSTGFLANKSTLTVTASTAFAIHFIFNGVAWVEYNR